MLPQHALHHPLQHGPQGDSLLLPSCCACLPRCARLPCCAGLRPSHGDPHRLLYNRLGSQDALQLLLRLLRTLPGTADGLLGCDQRLAGGQRQCVVLRSVLSHGNVHMHTRRKRRQQQGFAARVGCWSTLPAPTASSCPHLLLHRLQPRNTPSLPRCAMQRLPCTPSLPTAQHLSLGPKNAGLHPSKVHHDKVHPTPMMAPTCMV